MLLFRMTLISMIYYLVYVAPIGCIGPYDEFKLRRARLSQLGLWSPTLGCSEFSIELAAQANHLKQPWPLILLGSLNLEKLFKQPDMSDF